MGRQLLEMVQLETEAGQFIQVHHLSLLCQLLVDLLLRNTKETINVIFSANASWRSRDLGGINDRPTIVRVKFTKAWREEHTDSGI